MISNDSQIVDSRYRIIDFVAKGSFGEIYRVERRLDKGLYALKCENHIKDATKPTLLLEAKIIKSLRPKVDAIPSILHVGQEQGKGDKPLNIMIMDLYGPSIATLFEQANYRCTLETATNLGI